MKRVKTSDPVFNTIQDIIWLWKKYQKRVPAVELQSFDGFINYLISEGYSYDYGD